MKKSIRLCLVLLLFSQIVAAQTVPFPTGNRDFEAISPWGYTNLGTSWDTSPFLPFIYRDMWFRFMPPNGVTYNSTTKVWNYGSDPTKKYPLILFFQGAGEVGSDNNNQLKHGGEIHKNAVLNGSFPGFLLYPQSVDPVGAKALIEKLIATHPIDINRIYVHGLSNGAKWTWDFTIANPTLVAGFNAMSGLAAQPEDTDLFFTPFRQAQGGLDTNPGPNWTNDVVAWYQNNGGQVEYFYFPTLGHGTWNSMYTRSDFFSWFLSQKKNKIFALFNKTEFCPGATVNTTLGFTPGFDAYEWRKDGTLISGQSTNKLVVTSYGSYTGRIKNRGVWSDWSDAVVVKEKSPTQTPPIQLVSLQSKLVPDVNGNSSVALTLPAGYETYSWNKSGVTDPLGTSQTLTVTGPGSYTGTVKEIGGCSSLPSVPFVIVDANGTPKPDAASNLQVTTVNKTTLGLTWDNTVAPAVNETGFEIYRSTVSGGPYQLLITTAADVKTYTDSNLPSNTRYYYKVRAVAANGAAAPTAEASAVTDLDVTPPSAPNGLTVTSIGNNSVGLSWTASTDDVGVSAYDVYVRPQSATDYVKAYTTTATTQTVFQLSTNVLYSFIVKARDAAGNTSASSAMVTAATVFSGLYYSYYEGNWSVLPSFDALTPVATGTVTNFSLTPALKADYFGFKFTGTLYVPANNQYTFYLASDDGSKIWVNNTLVVDNDGLHGNGTEKSGKITLTAGYYPIRVDYFEGTGSNTISVKWSSASISKQAIPNANLKASYTAPTAPAAPSSQALTVIDYKSLRVNWATYTGTGTDIEIYRSLNNSTWSIIATVPKATANYTDAGLSASTKYYYRLRAINSGSVSAYSSTQNATTAALPALPLAPSNPVLSAITTSSATLTWTDNATNEDNFEVYKSVGNNTTYSKVATLGANVTTYTDNTLFAHTTYYFKVLSKNVRGSSAYSSEVSGTTLNNSPTLSGVRDVTLRYDDVVSVPLTGVDPDNDFLVIGGNSLPDFVNIFDYGDGTAVLEIEPTQANLGTYENLELFVEDLYSGRQTLTFKVVVNNNHNPVVAPLTPITVKESYIATATATATDADGDALTWTIQNAPSFMTSTINGNTVNLKFRPVTTDAGTYNITLTATDPTGGQDSKVLQVIVTDFDPNFSVKVNFRSDASYNGPAGWNNVSADPATTALIRDNGASSGISMVLAAGWSGWKDGYGSTAFGTYPAVVTNSYIYFYGSAPQTIRFQGLNPDGKYNLKFIASNKIADGASRLTTFASGGQTGSVEGNNNNSTLVSFTGLLPSSDGVLTMTVAGPSNGYAVLNALILDSFFDGNVAPAAPSNLALSVDAATQSIKSTWTDNSSNELSFELYRSTDNTTFTKVATLSTDVNTYLDASFTYAVTYYYKVRAINGIGASAYSNVTSIAGPNRVPVITQLSPVSLAELDFVNVVLQATDVDGDDMDFSLDNAPGFVWTEYMSNGKASLMINPDTGNAGAYQFQVNCTDSHGGVGTITVDVTVTGGNDVFVNVNFTVPTTLASAPWNNVTAYTSGTVASNLVNTNNATTTMSLTLQNTWTGTNPNGYTTGNNSGIYPDAVMSNSFYIQDDVARTILIGGLNTTKTYDFTFFASRSGVTDVRNTVFASGSKSAVLNASSNTSTLATVAGIKPNSSGQITLSITRQSGSAYGYMNSLVIREYDAVVVPTAPVAPTSLVSQVLTKNSIKLSWTDASDNETGFEIWRSTSNNTSYSLLTTVAAGTTTYTSAGLTYPTLYYYKVRALNEIGSSAYSNETTGTTFDFSVSVNFDAFNTGPTTWNNLSAFLSTGAVVSNLIDESGANTGISMTVVQEFAGDNPYGMNTGNNSGIVPDRVMEGSWWIDRAQVATLKFSNLSFLRKYNFSFFASRNGDGDRNTIYTINGNSVTLNASLNTNNIVQLKNISPDTDGSVTINVTTTSTALYGYLNGLIIQAFPSSSGGAGGSTADRFGEGAMKAYPNPFVDQFKVDVSSDQNSSKFKLSLLNATGVVVYEDYVERSSSEPELEVQLKDQLVQGVYLLRVKGNAGNAQTLKLLKK